jgi:hypothetical protein
MNTKSLITGVILLLASVSIEAAYYGSARSDRRFFNNAEQYDSNEGISTTTGPPDRLSNYDNLPEIVVATKSRSQRPLILKSRSATTKSTRSGVSFSDMAKSTQKRTGSYELSFSKMAKSASNKRISFDKIPTNNITK